MHLHVQYTTLHSAVSAKSGFNALLCALLLALVAVLATPGAFAADADRFAKVKVTSEKVAGYVHMLMGAGGNIAASIGPDGTLIVDDQFAPLAGRISDRLEALGGAKPELLINTHFHGDHTGSNANFGDSATIIAHENVRVRLVGNDSPRDALPAVTFADRVRVHYNDEAIDIVHLPAGHTDGDSVVWFRGANVLHMGDHLFTGVFPYIDVDSGGSVRGFMKNLEAALELVNAETRVIPGHGPLGGIAAIEQSLGLVRESALLIMRETEAGKSDAQIIQLLNTEFAEAAKGFISAERWLGIVRKSRTANE